LDARISASPPSASLPTPPSHKPASPDASRFAVEYYSFAEEDIAKVSGKSIGTGCQLNLKNNWHVLDALSILLEYYSVQDIQSAPHVLPLTTV
jgi:hypothetical protein